MTKGQEHTQQHQRSCWKGHKQSPGAGSSQEAVEWHAGMRVIEREWYLLGPRHEERETEEAEGLQPEEAAGTEATKLPGHNPQKWT